MQRYLTPPGKKTNLAFWESRKSDPRPSGDLSGKGWPDPEIIPLCDALNQLPGVCTLQSCCGHGGAGHLWLWLDEVLSREMDRWGHVLARMHGIEVVSRKYTHWGQEITAIEFDGRAEFNKACESVLIFFSTLAANRDSYRRSP